MINKVGGKSAEAFRTISEVSDDIDVPQHVLRFWETKFNQVKPMKRGGGRRYYRPDDVALLKHIRSLLYDDGYTIRGVQRLLGEKGMRTVLLQARQASCEEDLVVHPTIQHGAGPESLQSSAVIKTEIDPNGIGAENRRALEAVLKDLQTIREGIER